MVTVLKRKLSGSTDGMGISVHETATAGTTIHQAVAGTTAGTFDEVWLWAQNIDTSSHKLTIEYGGAEVAKNIEVTVPGESGLYLVLPGLILQNSLVVKAFADAADLVVLHGFVNAITDA